MSICPSRVLGIPTATFKNLYQAIDRIMANLKLMFVAAKPPRSYIFGQVTLMAAEGGGDHF
jgi:tRNA(Glu) U13 pseudouridine synthase TruD